MNKHYSLHLPTFKQGDDFSAALEAANNDPIKGFLNLAEQYMFASEICKNISEVLSKVKDIKAINAGGDTHNIWLNAPAKLVKSLVKEEILIEDSFEE